MPSLMPQSVLHWALGPRCPPVAQSAHQRAQSAHRSGRPSLCDLFFLPASAHASACFFSRASATSLLPVPVGTGRQEARYGRTQVPLTAGELVCSVVARAAVKGTHSLWVLPCPSESLSRTMLAHSFVFDPARPQLLVVCSLYGPRRIATGEERHLSSCTRTPRSGRIDPPHTPHPHLPNSAWLPKASAPRQAATEPAHRSHGRSPQPCLEAKRPRELAQPPTIIPPAPAPLGRAARRCLPPAPRRRWSSRMGSARRRS